jgi:hypothetical protein
VNDRELNDSWTSATDQRGSGVSFSAVNDMPKN